MDAHSTIDVSETSLVVLAMYKASKDYSYWYFSHQNTYLFLFID